MCTEHAILATHEKQTPKCLWSGKFGKLNEYGFLFRWRWVFKTSIMSEFEHTDMGLCGLKFIPANRSIEQGDDNDGIT